eukprot:1763776-Amphidinium_carterae.1
MVRRSLSRGYQQCYTSLQNSHTQSQSSAPREDLPDAGKDPRLNDNVKMKRAGETKPRGRNNDKGRRGLRLFQSKTRFALDSWKSIKGSIRVY